MRALPSELRRQLEAAVLAGRRAAEAGVRAALLSLGVQEEDKPAHLDEDRAQLRRGLRAKQRQLGGDFDVLLWECAYEQWHRLLFARFLAENGLLQHPEFGAPVTLADCEELAVDLGEPDGWSVAGRFAAEILPGIFRLDDPCVQLRLAPEHRVALEKVVAGLPKEVFAADDSLGWVYQYWQKERKDQVNASEVKIGGADIGPVTQLFTENYMVRFLLENSLGAWWAARHPDSPLIREFEYLRFDKDGQPAAGTFDGWPERVAEVTVMDPCCGSGHFLVEAFGMLWRMRAEEEGLDRATAQDAVLQDNLYGLELDPRCVQIAMFAVALTAWKQGGWRELPVPHIACPGIPAKASLNEWTALTDGDEQLGPAVERLHTLFRDADTLGSLIDPRRASEMVDASGIQRSFDDVDFDEIAPLLQQAVEAEIADPAIAVLGADVTSIARAADYLSRLYTLVATNPPFLGRGDQELGLQNYISNCYAIGQQDLATAFLLRAEGMCQRNGSLSFVLPQESLTLRSFEKLRRKILKDWDVPAIVNLGPSAFETISGEKVKPVLVIIQLKSAHDRESLAIDVLQARSANDKAKQLRSVPFSTIPQASQLKNPDSRILFIVLDDIPSLDQFAGSYTGLQTGEDTRFKRCFWEFDEISDGWERAQSSPSRSGIGLGREHLILWESGTGTMATSPGSTIRGRSAWGSNGLVVSKVGSLYWTDYAGGLFDDSAIVIIPTSKRDAGAVAAFLADEIFRSEVRKIDQKVAVTPGTVVKVRFDVDRWRQVAAERYPDELPEPRSDDPTQWLFEGRPEVSTQPLEVAIGRLLGYRWPEQPESDELDEFVDRDGIVCLPAVAREQPAAERLQALLARAYGGEWTPGLSRRLLEQAGSSKMKLADWLRDDFFKHHCRVFANRPFVWHIWDRRKDGFSALVNYHRLDRAGLEKLTYTYLGDWIERQRADAVEDVAGADVRLAAARELKGKLEAILEGEPPYDIYVRWKDMHEQPIGWEPDLDDGVRLNIRPFVKAGVLRAKVNVHWRNDRGKNPDGSERRNDRHYTIAEKRDAREKARHG